MTIFTCTCPSRCVCDDPVAVTVVDRRTGIRHALRLAAIGAVLLLSYTAGRQVGAGAHP